MRKRFYQRDGFQIWVVLIGLFLWFLIAFRREIGQAWMPIGSMFNALVGGGVTAPITPDVIRGLLVVLVNLIGYGFFFYLALHLVSLYVLPVTNKEERRQVLSRLVEYPSSHHGPTIFVKEGRVVASPGELQRRGSGAVLIDLASAVVLEKQGANPQARVEGAGLAFTAHNEKIRGVVDLRPQLRLRTDVHANTRDGIEIATNVSTVFTLGELPQVLYVTFENELIPENIRVIHIVEEFIQRDETGGFVHQAKIIKRLSDELDTIDKEEIHRFVNSLHPAEIQPTGVYTEEDLNSSAPFTIDHQHVFAALYSQAKDVKAETYTDWSELPPHVATEIFRVMLADVYYDELYDPSHPNKFPLKEFKARFTNKVRNQGVLAYQFLIRKDGSSISAGQEWDENQFIAYPVQELRQPKVLRARGIKLINAGFSELKPVNPGVRQRFLENWRARWERDAEVTLADHELQAMRIKNQARVQTQREMTRKLTAIFDSTPLSQEALALRVYQALETLATDPATRRLLPADTINLLKSLRSWILPQERPLLETPKSKPKRSKKSAAQPNTPAPGIVIDPNKTQASDTPVNGQ